MGPRTYRLLPIAISALSLIVLTACSGVSGTSPSNSSLNSSGGSDTSSGSSGGNSSNSSSPPGSFQSVQHIVFLAQENEGFDHYFGHINSYRASLGLSTEVNGTPENASNPSFDGGDIAPFHLRTTCMPNLSPSWNESHVSFDLNNHLSMTFVGNGFAWTAGNYASTAPDGGGETHGYRAMGYYTEEDLPYYYFMATQYSMPDNWFAPAPTRTQPNRLYLYAATSHGHIYEPTDSDGGQLPDKTIFDLLQAAGISWKIYYTDCRDKADARKPGVTCTPANQDQYFGNFSSSDNPKMQANVRPVNEYFTDLTNGTLPAVALIEGGYTRGLDEHPKNNIWDGAAYVKTLVDALQASSSWSSSIFILTYDEGGDFYDNAAPLSVPSPDGIKPMDFLPGDICSGTPGAPACDFTRTGFRLPVIFISPFSALHGVSHTGYDNTAILRLIESRWNLPQLNHRDAAMPDPSIDPNLFDWTAPNLAIPGNIPEQPDTQDRCNPGEIP
jgi:phospholipase C